MIAHRLLAADLRADPERVIARLYLPGEESPYTRSRTSHVVARVLAIPWDRIESSPPGYSRHSLIDTTITPISLTSTPPSSDRTCKTPLLCHERARK